MSNDRHNSELVSVPTAQEQAASIGETIRRCREKRGMSQEEVARMIGVDVETIAAFESGDCPELLAEIERARQHGFGLVAVPDELRGEVFKFIGAECVKMWKNAFSKLTSN